MRSWALVLVVAMAAGAAAGRGGETPTLKWGQSASRLFLAFSLPTALPDTVAAEVTRMNVSVSGSDGEVVLFVPFREPVGVDGDHEGRAHVCTRPDERSYACDIGKETPHFHDALVAPRDAHAVVPRDLAISINWGRWEEPDDSDLNVLDEYSVGSSIVAEVTDDSADAVLAAHDLVVLDVSYPWCYRCARLRTALKKAAASLAKRARSAAAPDSFPHFVYADARENPGLRDAFDASCVGGGCGVTVIKAGEAHTFYVPPEPVSAARIVERLSSYIGPLATTLPSPDAVATLLDRNAAAGLAIVAVFYDSSPANAGANAKLDTLLRAVSARYRRDWVLAEHHGDHGGETSVAVYPKPSVFDATLGGRDALVTTYTGGELAGDDERALETRLVVGTQPVVQEYSWSLRESADELDFPVATLWINVSATENSVRASLVEPLTGYAQHIAAARHSSTVFFFSDAGQAFMAAQYGLDTAALPAFGIRSKLGGDDARLYGIPLVDELAASAPASGVFETEAGPMVAAVNTFLEAFDAGSLRRGYMSRTLTAAEVAHNADPTVARVLNQDMLVELLDRVADDDDPLAEVVVLFYRGWQKGVEYAIDVLNRVTGAIVADGSIGDSLVVGAYDGAGNSYDVDVFASLSESGDAPVLYSLTATETSVLMGKDAPFYASTLWKWLKTHSPTVAANWRALVATRRALVAADKAEEEAKAATLAVAPKIELDGTSAYKQVIAAGTGDVPPEGARVNVRHELRYGDEGRALITRTNMAAWQTPHTFELGQGQVLRCLDLVVATMRVGERAFAWCPPELGYGSAGSPDAKVPPNTPLAYEVHLVSFADRAAQPPPPPPTDDESLDEFKQRMGLANRDEL